MVNVVSNLLRVKRLSDSGRQAGIASNINITSLHLSDPDLSNPDSFDSQVGLFITPDRAITAIQDTNRRLKLIAWT